MAIQLNYVASIEALREEVRSMLMAEGKKRAEKLVLIDTVERLGIGYHFEQLIEDQLQQIFQSINSTNYEDDGDDLFITSLQFRLLRQHRHFVPCSVFDKFRAEGDNNKFKESLHGDAKGLLSLYEAAHLQITHGEEILEEAVAFTTHHLKRLLSLGQLELSSSLQYQVSRALEQPLHRGVQRIETRYYISSYEKLDDLMRNETLLKFAKLDFNYVQSIYKKELCEVSWWWNELDLVSKLPYARSDRVAEAYLWGMAFLFEPQYSNVRIAVAKVIQMLAIIDDTYDNYATVEEADLFTEAMQRWDMNEIHRLPNKMKIVYRFVLNLYDDYEREAAKQGKLFAVPYAKETVKQLCKAYNEALKWFMGLQVPTFEDYLVNSVVTGCLYVITTAAFPHIKHASSETIDWLMSQPKILSATSLLGRYWDDSGSHERESKHGQMLTGVDFYMKQHGLSKEETIEKFAELGENEWKEVNASWMMSKSITCKDMANEILNIARAVEITYKNCKDEFTSPETIYKTLINDMFVDPIPTDQCAV